MTPLLNDELYHGQIINEEAHDSENNNISQQQISEQSDYQENQNYSINNNIMHNRSKSDANHVKTATLFRKPQFIAVKFDPKNFLANKTNPLIQILKPRGNTIEEGQKNLPQKKKNSIDQKDTQQQQQIVQTLSIPSSNQYQNQKLSSPMTSEREMIMNLNDNQQQYTEQQKQINSSLKNANNTETENKQQEANIFAKKPAKQQSQQYFVEHDFGPQFRDGKLLQYSILGKTQVFKRIKEQTELLNQRKQTILLKLRNATRNQQQLKHVMTNPISNVHQQHYNYQILNQNQNLQNRLEIKRNSSIEQTNSVVNNSDGQEQSSHAMLQNFKIKLPNKKTHSSDSHSNSTSTQKFQIQSCLKSPSPSPDIKSIKVDRSVLIDRLNNSLIYQKNSLLENRRKLKELSFSDQISFTKEQRIIQNFDIQQKGWKSTMNKIGRISGKHESETLISKVDDARKRNEIVQAIAFSYQKGIQISENKQWQVNLRKYQREDPTTKEGRLKMKLNSKTLDYALTRYTEKKNYKMKEPQRDYDKEEQILIQKGKRVIEKIMDLPCCFIPTIEAEQPIVTKIRKPILMTQQQINNQSIEDPSLHPKSLTNIIELNKEKKKKNQILQTVLVENLDKVEKLIKIEDELQDFQVVGQNKFNIEKDCLLKTSSANDKYKIPNQIQYLKDDISNNDLNENEKYQVKHEKILRSNFLSPQLSNKINEEIIVRNYDNKSLSKQGMLYFPKLKINL